MIQKYKELVKYIEANDKITIYTHIHPDGDTIGSAITLKKLIEINFQNKVVKISGDNKHPVNLKWMGKNKKVSDKFIRNSLAIIVDMPSLERVYDQRIQKVKKILKIDHHPDNGYKWLMSIVDTNAHANGIILVDLIRKLNLKYDSEILNALFVAIWTDTCWLVGKKADSPSTKDAIKWLADNGVNESAILKKLKHKKSYQIKKEQIAKKYEYLLGKKVALNLNDFVIDNKLYRDIVTDFAQSNTADISIFVSKIKGRNSRVSFRSTKYDVSKLAKQFNGGGHTFSAGAIIDDASNFNNDLIKFIKKLYKLT